jgi:hypothetical protein
MFEMDSLISRMKKKEANLFYVDWIDEKLKLASLFF